MFAAVKVMSGRLDTVDVCCRASRVYRPECRAIFRQDDPEPPIPWPMPVKVPSERERSAPSLAVIEPMPEKWLGAVH
jgi:dTDP-4-dehydrorhamnose 3,5-epimerase-like enzyme